MVTSFKEVILLIFNKVIIFIDLIFIIHLIRGKIVHVEPFIPPGSAISEKHIVVIELDGELYKTMAKLFQSPRSTDFTPMVIDASMEEHEIFRRADRDFQAFPEIVGYHVDRVLGIYRKPVFASRIVTNKVLYKNVAWFPRWSFGIIVKSFEYKMKYFSHEYNIYISLQPWMDGLKNSPPSLKIRDYLTLANKDLPIRDDKLMKELIEVSDTLVYDFLVDEHDRKAEKNWVTSKDGTQLLWDNGLAFDHGPFGKTSCLDILCASNEWRNTRPKDKPCERICRFSRSLYERLDEFKRSSKEYSLGRLVEKSVSNDLLSPLFHFALYEHFKDDRNLISYKIQNFWDGMEVKLDRMIDHIHGCVRRYGENTVLI